MNESTLVKISLLGSIIGISLLIILSFLNAVDGKRIDSIDVTDATVKVRGVVTSVDTKDSLLVIEVMQQNTIDAVVFTDGGFDIRKGDEIELLGTVSEFRGQPQIIANEVRLLR